MQINREKEVRILLLTISLFPTCSSSSFYCRRVSAGNKKFHDPTKLGKFAYELDEEEKYVGRNDSV